MKNQKQNLDKAVKEKKIDWTTHPLIKSDSFQNVIQVDFSKIKPGIYLSTDPHKSCELIMIKGENNFSTIQRYQGGIRCSNFFSISVNYPCYAPTLENLFYREEKFVFFESDPKTYRSLDSKLRDMGLSGDIQK